MTCWCMTFDRVVGGKRKSTDGSAPFPYPQRDRDREGERRRGRETERETDREGWARRCDAMDGLPLYLTPAGFEAAALSPCPGYCGRLGKATSRCHLPSSLSLSLSLSW
jgi:hypothetical protein